MESANVSEIRLVLPRVSELSALRSTEMGPFEKYASCFIHDNRKINQNFFEYKC